MHFCPSFGASVSDSMACINICLRDIFLIKITNWDWVKWTNENNDEEN